MESECAEETAGFGGGGIRIRRKRRGGGKEGGNSLDNFSSRISCISTILLKASLIRCKDAISPRYPHKYRRTSQSIRILQLRARVRTC